MINQYETFRERIIASIVAGVIKENDTKTRVSYDWSIAKVFKSAGEQCGFQNTSILPEDFKKIVRFEFNKLKDEVLSNDGFELTRSRVSPKLTDTGVALVRTDSHTKTAVGLEEQLSLAVIMLGEVTNKLSNATEEKAVGLKKRRNAITMRIDYLRAELERQAKLIAVVNESLNASDAEVKIETTVVK